VNDAAQCFIINTFPILFKSVLIGLTGLMGLPHFVRVFIYWQHYFSIKFIYIRMNCICCLWGEKIRCSSWHYLSHLHSDQMHLQNIFDNLCFVGMFAKLWKATVNFILSVCLSLHPHGTTWLQLDIFWWNFMSILWKSIRKIKVSLKSDKNSRSLVKINIYFFYHILLISS